MCGNGWSRTSLHIHADSEINENAVQGKGGMKGGTKQFAVKASPAKSSPGNVKSTTKGVLSRPMAMSVANVMANRQPFTKADTIDQSHPQMRAILRGMPVFLSSDN